MKRGYQFASTQIHVRGLVPCQNQHHFYWGNHILFDCVEDEGNEYRAVALDRCKLSVGHNGRAQVYDQVVCAS